MFKTSNIFMLLILYTSCGSEKTDSRVSPSKTGSQENNAPQGLKDSSFALENTPCLENTPGPEHLDFSNDTINCKPPTTIKLQNQIYDINTREILNALYEVSSDAYQKQTNQVCMCGCYLTEYSPYLPKLDAIIKNMRGTYQTVDACTKTEEGTICSSDPKELTTLGRSYFITDFLTQLYLTAPDTFKEDKIDTSLLKRYLISK